MGSGVKPHRAGITFVSAGGGQSGGMTDNVANHGDPGVSCIGNGGRCVDLGGASGDPGQITTKVAIAYQAGDLVTLSFMARGNVGQRLAGELSAGFTFMAPMAFEYFTGGSFALASGSAGDTVFGLYAFDELQPNDPYAPYTMAFIGSEAGSAFFDILSFGGPGGPILDDVTVDIQAAAVPEPLVWAVMVLGLAGVGSTLRRRAERRGAARAYAARHVRRSTGTRPRRQQRARRRHWLPAD